MAKPYPKTPEPATSIEILGARLQRIINAPAAQKAHEAIIYKASDESQQDWDQIIEAITETDGVHVAFEDDGATRVYWDVPEND